MWQVGLALLAKAVLCIFTFGIKVQCSGSDILKAMQYKAVRKKLSCLEVYLSLRSPAYRAGVLDY